MIVENACVCHDRPMRKSPAPLLSFIVSIALTSCAASRTSSYSEDLTLGSSTASGCAVPEGWMEIASLNPKYVVFGELHGTQEAPTFVGNTLCGLAMSRERLLLAVEHSSFDNDKLQAAWLLPTDKFRRVLPSTGWEGRDDGVASHAMFAMVVRAHELSQRGLPIDIVAFNGPRDAAQRAKWAHLPSQGPHEAAQAENIHIAGSAKPYDRVLVLVGNLHAEKQSVDMGSGAFEPMAMHLGKLGRMVSLNMRYADGYSWSCQLRADFVVQGAGPIPDEAIDCAKHPQRGESDLERLPFINVDRGLATTGSSNYDGFFWVGPISASEPFRQE